MLVSVVIPAYNAQRFIREAALSALEQTHRDLQVIIVDDASQDETAEIAASINDDRLRVLRLSANSGPAAARNAGLEYVKGDLVGFLDADDTWDPEKVEKQLGLFEDDVAAVGAVMRYVSAAGQVAGTTGRDPEATGETESVRDGNLMPFTISSALFRSHLARQVGGFDPALRKAEDLDFVARIALHGRVRCANEPLGSYRVHGGSATSADHSELIAWGRFVATRIKARREGQDLTWEQFRASHRRTSRQRRQDAAGRYHRKAREHEVLGHHARALLYWSGAVVLAPGYAIRRLWQRIRV
jgi:glycosyltransferase involved in cell wall biosynthesis